MTSLDWVRVLGIYSVTVGFVYVSFQPMTQQSLTAQDLCLHVAGSKKPIFDERIQLKQFLLAPWIRIDSPLDDE